MSTVITEAHRHAIAEMRDWQRAYNQVKEQYEGIRELYRSSRGKVRELQQECVKARTAYIEAQNNDRIAMAWIADIKAAVGCEHMDMPQLVEYLKTIKPEVKP